MSKPYLVAHKSGGQAVWDIAVQMVMGDEIWWVLQSGGWRVYPWRALPLQDCSGSVGEHFFEGVLEEMPEDAEDCFEYSVKPNKENLLQGFNLLNELGLIKREPVRRI